MNILLIEDNRDISINIFDYFEAKGHTIDLAEDGVTGLHLSVTNPYDVLILDWMLPGMDGVTLCRRLREAGRQTPVLMLTARDALNDKIEGLEAGADDYVVKPFALREIEARVNALLRRSKAPTERTTLKVGDLSFNTGTLKVTRGERSVELPPIPMKFLELLMRQSPRVIPREEVERAIWGDLPPDSDALRAHLHLLRKAIDGHGGNPLIKTHRGMGYQISDE